MEDYRKELLEFVATPGITSKDREEIKLRGFKEPVYTSQILRDKLKSEIRKHMPSYSIEIFEKLIDEHKIISVYVSKSIWHYLQKRKEIQQEKILGYFELPSAKIYLFMETMLGGISLFTNVKRGSILNKTLFHECMHMAAWKDPQRFLNFNAKPLMRFYSFVMFNYFKIKNENKEKAGKIIWKWIETSVKEYESKLVRSKTAKATQDLLSQFDDLTSLAEIEMDVRTRIFYQSWLDYMNHHEANRRGEELYEWFDEAYPKLFKIDARKDKLGMVLEEITSPSAVISKLASNNPNLPYVKKSLRLTV